MPAKFPSWTVSGRALVLATLFLSGCRERERPQPTIVVDPVFASKDESGRGQPALPRVVVLSTGGTIATRYNAEKKTALPALTGKEMISAVPQIGELADVAVEQVAQVGSADITPEIWLALRERAERYLLRPDITALVVTHGTDTLEETAYFLDLTLASTKPLVLVGAQRMASDPAADGPRNLLDAMRVAVDPASRGQGVLVVMAGEIHAAREVTKASTVDLVGFKSPRGPLGTVTNKKVSYQRASAGRQHIALTSGVSLPRVEIVAHYAGADGWLVRSLLAPSFRPGAPHLDGLVIAATGLGHVSASMYDEVAEARKRGIPVIISTRVPSGPTLPLYPGKGLGLSLRDLGCIFVNDLSPQKARILLMLALTRTHDPQELQRYFAD